MYLGDDLGRVAGRDRGFHDYDAIVLLDERHIPVSQE
jgi:hypothetical protein